MPSTCHRGFTLVELLVVIAIIAVLASLLVAVLGRIRTSGNVAAETNNLRQIGLALNLYVGDNDGQYPFVNLDPSKMSDPTAQPSDYWSLQLSPYLPHKVTMEKQASVFQSPMVPAENRHPISDYGANLAVFRDANPGNSARATSRLRSVAIPSPASTVAVCTAWYRPATDRKGNWAGSWLVITHTYVEEGTASSMPQPRLPSLPDPAASPNDLQGRVGALFCDGHVEQIDWQKFHANRAKYLEMR